MSINIPGTLTVQIIQGRRGPFKTAKLATSIGTFDVKNPVLKQFEPGEYQGNFIIEQLKVKAYEWGGGATSYGFSDEQSNHASTFDPVSENGIELPEFAESVEQVEQMIEDRWSHIRFGEYILADREDLRNVVSIVREAGYSYDPREKTWYI